MLPKSLASCFTIFDFLLEIPKPSALMPKPSSAGGRDVQRAGDGIQPQRDLGEAHCVDPHAPSSSLLHSNLEYNDTNVYEP